METFSLPTCENCYTRLKEVFCDWEGNPCKEITFQHGCLCNMMPPGHIIFHEGTPPMGLYYLSRGKVKIYKLGEGGKKQIIRLAKKGEAIGYKSLISGQVYSATAEVIESTCFCFIPKETFFNIVNTTPEVCIKIMRRLTQDMNLIEKIVMNLAHKTVRERVALAILSMAQTYGLEQDGATIKVELMREDIANIVGTATESVIRLLSEFKKDKLIEVRGRKIKILNKDALLRTAYIFD